ncbi:Mus7/MMS22 family-domain-containing protein [Gloeopeniophorella convolvens]|nr:Mus7/MMS22 family-domain-containing protein [Gloeopeniophorella convolvens]
MNLADTASTSDAEEREYIDALNPAYWEHIDSVINLSSHDRNASPSQSVAEGRRSPPDPFVIPSSPIAISPIPAPATPDQLSPAQHEGLAFEGRYSMRTRLPRQLKPYAFDRVQYKYQMKNNPDAIVKFTGHRNPVESSPSRHSDGSESDAAGVASGSGGGHSEHARRRFHAKGKQRHRDDVGLHGGASLKSHKVSEARLPARSPRGQRSAGSPIIGESSALQPALGESGSPELGQEHWYPDAFRDVFSEMGSDDDPLDAIHHAPQGLQTPPPKRKRLRPHKPPALSPLASSQRTSLPVPPTTSPEATSVQTISSDASTEDSSSKSGSSDSSLDIANLSPRSIISIEDNDTPSPTHGLGRSQPRAKGKQRLGPSRFPVITDYLDRRQAKPSEKRRRRKLSAPDRVYSTKVAAMRIKKSDTRTEKHRSSRDHTRHRRPRPQAQTDLSVFTTAGGRVMSGWQRRNAVTIDAEDIAFQRALAPLASRTRTSSTLQPSRLPRIWRPPPGRAARDRTSNTGVGSPTKRARPEPEMTRHRIILDLGIPLLPLGRVFSANSYLGRGWLHELLSTLSGMVPSNPPPSFEIDGHALSSISSAQEFAAFLPDACDSFTAALSGAVTTTPSAFADWTAQLHAVCLFVSWIAAPASEADADLIRTASSESMGSLVAHIDTLVGDSAGQAISVNSCILCLHWFAVELLLRAYWSAAKKDKDLATAINARISGLVSRLLHIGIQEAVSPALVDGDPLDDFFLPVYTAELWICLVHLGAAYDEAFRPRDSSASGLGDVLQRNLPTAESLSRGDLHASEEIWCVIFSLCALSQFSSHGVSTSTPRMKTSWELVLRALDHIRLTADPQADRDLSSRSLRRRDAYIRLVVSRCFVLHQRWSWRLDDESSSALFRRLVEVFKSRKFADLRGEIAGFPAFMQENNVRLLSENGGQDSAFTIFLKLIFAAASQMKPSMREEEYVGKAKKLLSLVTPVGSVQLDKLQSPFDHELSMLYNRFSSVALAVRVYPSVDNAQYRISLARRYIGFAQAAAATRSVCIRAANFLALQAFDLSLPLSPALEWTAEITHTLVSEFHAAAQRPEGDGHAPRLQLMQCFQLLLAGLDDLSRSATSSDRGTDIALEILQKGCISMILTQNDLCVIPTIQGLLQHIVQLHYSHSLLLQQQQGLKAEVIIQEDSQDEYGQFDLDWNDPEVLAALQEDGSINNSNSYFLLVKQIVDSLTSLRSL